MTVAPERIVFEEELPPGGKWSHALTRHQALRLTDVDGGGNVSALLYNRDLLSERYNMPDTLKAQYTGFLTKGHVLFSDRGRVLCSITGDTCGWHDTLCGHTGARSTAARYGEKTYQAHRNKYHRNAHDSFLMELGKWGLGKEDIVPNVNFFSKVTADEDGELRFAVDNSRAGDYVDLRAEMNVLVILVSAPHPLALDTVYAPKRVRLSVYRADAPRADDPCRTSRPEAGRGFENTERYFA
jgi:urea carboxylase-associated protein 2